MWYHDTVHRLFQDDLASVSISRLRASGVVTGDTKSVVLFSVTATMVSGARSRLSTAASPTAGNGRFSCARLLPYRAFLSFTKTHVSALLSSPRGWVSHIERLAGRARRSAGGAAPEVARAPRRRAGEIASEARPPAGPPMVAYGFVAEGDDPRASGSAATAP